MAKMDLTGQRCGNLVAIKEVDPWVLPSGRKQRMYFCACDCGNTCTVRVNDFQSGKSTSCGCKRNKTNHNRMFEDLSGRTFGRLTVIKRVEDYVKKSGEKKVQWLCKCSCGNEILVTSHALKCGNTKSCGCYKRDMTRKRCFQDLTGRVFGHLKVLSFDHMEGKHSIYKCLCDCGTICFVSGNHLRRHHTTSCGHICSIMEDAVNKYLLENKYEYKYHVMFDDLQYQNYLEFDFGIYRDGDLLCLIECQGRQHFDDVGEFGKLQRDITDDLKRKYCQDNLIPLMSIRYDEDPIEKLKLILDNLHVNPVPSL